MSPTCAFRPSQAYALGMRSGAASVAEVGVDRMTFLKDNYPKELAAVTSEWLGKLVEAEVASFESLPLVTGQISDAAIITCVLLPVC